jgi:hypothetical protein
MNKAQHDIHVIIFPTEVQKLPRVSAVMWVYNNAEFCPFIQIDWKKTVTTFKDILLSTFSSFQSPQ